MIKTILLTLGTIFLISNAWNQMVLRVDDARYFSGTTDNVLTISLANDQNVGGLCFDLRFDPECFTIDPESLSKTERTEELDIFQASNPEPGIIKLAGTGIGTSIAPGSGSVAKFTVDVDSECEAGQYIFALSIPILTDPYWPDVFDAVDGTITVETTDSEVILSLDDCAVLQDSKENKITLNLENTVQIAAYQTDVLFDTTCFKVVSARRTGRNPFDIFNWSNIDGGIRILNTGVGTVLTEGNHVVAEIFTDVTSCPEGDYTWDVCNSMVADPAGGCPSIKEYDGTITIVTGTKGDVNEDGMIDVRDAVLTAYYMLALILLSGPDAIWAADCNGPPGNCDGDGNVDVSDVMKIVNLILGLDECLDRNVIYFNSFESAEDMTGWIMNDYQQIVNDPAPGCGEKSLYVIGGCMQPIGYIELPQQLDDGKYTMTCWGKADWAGSIALTTNQPDGERTYLYLSIDTPEWISSNIKESIFCPKDQKLRIEIYHGGIMATDGMFIDCLKVEKVE